MFKCIDCLSGVAPACFICNEREGERVKCSATACGKYYHSGCLKTWPQVKSCVCVIAIFLPLIALYIPRRERENSSRNTAKCNLKKSRF